MKARKRLANPLALAVLVLLFERPMHPYEMASTLKERGKEQSIKLNYGSLYTVIEQLLREGYIAAGETLREGNRPEKTVYVITPAGSAEMSDWLGELLSEPAKEYPRFEAALSLMPALPPEAVVTLLESRLVRLQERLQAEHAGLAMAADMKVPALFLVEGHYQIALINTEISFVKKLCEDIRSGTLEGVSLWRSLHARNTGGTPGQDERS